MQKTCLLPKTLTFLHPELQLSTKYCWVLIMLQGDTPSSCGICSYTLDCPLPSIETASQYYLRGYLKTSFVKQEQGPKPLDPGTWQVIEHLCFTASDSRSNPHYCWLCMVPFTTWWRPDHRTYTAAKRPVRFSWMSLSRIVGSESHLSGNSTYVNAWRNFLPLSSRQASQWQPASN